MKMANLDGRLVLVVGGGTIDVEAASAGQFGPDPQSVFERWDDFREWAENVSAPPEPFDSTRLGPPVPSPRQVFAIALNYSDHAAESGFALPERPSVFTKFSSSLTGPSGDIALIEAGDVDWEVELVAVIGRTARCVDESDGWDHVAGLTVGQDISERKSQLAGAVPQFSMGKSFPRFSPTGPWLTSVDELADPDNLEIGCSVNGESVQKGRTSDLIFSVPTLVAQLSEVVTLWPGDLIFTGTPAGVGLGRTPQRFLSAGDELVSTIEGLGSMTHLLTEPVRAGR